MYKNLSKILIGIAVILIIIAGIIMGIYFSNKTDNNETHDVINLGTDMVGNEQEANKEKDNEENKTKEIKIFNGNDRPYAVMIDNHLDALPQAGINKAYIVYEMIVEGGETRLMALF